MQTTIQPPNGRGCGDRKEGDAYLCCGTAPEGMPIEFFIRDPARPIPWQRGVKVVRRASGIYDILIFVGIDPKGGKTEGYPSAWSFVEEARHFGASRKAPKDFPYHLLTPGESGMHFAHARAIPNFWYSLQRERRPLYGCKQFQEFADYTDLWLKVGNESGHHVKGEKWESLKEQPLDSLWSDSILGLESDPCTFALRDLAYLLHDSPINKGKGKFTIEMPSFSFDGMIPEVEVEYNQSMWQCGVFMSLPLTHIEAKGHLKPGLQEKINTAGYEAVILDW